MSHTASGVIKHETDNAVLFLDDSADEAVWIPCSQIERMSKYPSGEAEITMTDWIAEQKGLT